MTRPPSDQTAAPRRPAPLRVVFDLDGTLIDSAPDVRSVANAVLDLWNAAPLTLEQTRDFMGEGVPTFVARMCRQRELPIADHDAVMAEFLARYDDAVTLTEPYPGAIRMLEDLRAAGAALAVCTNKPLAPTRAVLRHLDMERLFVTVIAGDSLPTRKPDPAMLHAAFAALGGDGLRIYVGDSETDAETARRAEVPFVLFTEGYRKGPLDQVPRDHALSDLAALPDLLAQLRQAAAG